MANTSIGFMLRKNWTNMRLHRRSHMTLIETLIAMTILSFLLVTIFGFFYEIAIIDRSTKWQQAKAFQLRHVESRLLTVFSHLENETNSRFCFETETPEKLAGGTEKISLAFNYQNGVRRNPLFAGLVLARLYVDANHQLCLATWPIREGEEKWTMQKEVLLEHVEEIEFEFLTFSSLAAQVSDERRWEWVKEWQERNEMPLIMKIHVAVKNEPDPSKKAQTKEIEVQLEKMTYIFPMPISKANKVIYYPL